MGDLSTGAMMAWQVAAAEALALESEFIEPAHLLIGICSAEKLGLTGEEWDAVSYRLRLAI